MSSCCLIDANITGGARAWCRSGRCGGQPRGAQPPAANAPSAAVPAPAPPAAGGPGRGATCGCCRTECATGPRDERVRARGAGAVPGAEGVAAALVTCNSGLAAAWAPNPKNPPQVLRYCRQGRRATAAGHRAVRGELSVRDAAAVHDQPEEVQGDQAGRAVCRTACWARTVSSSSRWTALGVPHAFETYEGDHTNKVVERIEQKVLPFFSEQPVLHCRRKSRRQRCTHHRQRPAAKASKRTPVRPSGRALHAVLRRDVGALLVLRDARAARPLHDQGLPRHERRRGVRRLRRVHGARLHDAVLRRHARRSPAGRAARGRARRAADGGRATC